MGSTAMRASTSPGTTAWLAPLHVGPSRPPGALTLSGPVVRVDLVTALDFDYLLTTRPAWTCSLPPGSAGSSPTTPIRPRSSREPADPGERHGRRARRRRPASLFLGWSCIYPKFAEQPIRESSCSPAHSSRPRRARNRESCRDHAGAGPSAAVRGALGLRDANELVGPGDNSIWRTHASCRP